MKRILCLLLACLVLFSFASCSNSPKDETDVPDDQTDQTPADDKDDKKDDGEDSKEETPSGADIDRGGYDVTVLTGPTSGLYYSIGSAFYSLAEGLGYKASLTATSATQENITLITTGQGELAVAMSDAVIQAVEGFGAFEESGPNDDLRAMMGLWPNYCQIVTVEGTGVTSFEDMKGKRVAVGPMGSGVELNARMMFEAHGMTYDDCASVDYLNYDQSIDALKNGQCDAVFNTSGLGNATVLELATTSQVVLVPIEGDALETLIDKYPFYTEAVIEKDVYDTESDVTTAAVMNIMLVDGNLPDEVVYDLLECFLSDSGLSAIHAAHNTAKENISVENALRGIAGTSVKLHPGAIQYYEDNGIDVK